jgi:glycine betaine/proline transport system substrate-binding protein
VSVVPVATKASTSEPSASPGQAVATHRSCDLRIGWTAWADAELVTAIARRIAEGRLGCSVQLVMADVGIQYQGLDNGDLDIMLMAWLPLTHKDYYQKVADRVVNLGPLYTRARLGWAVPDYVPKSELASIADLAKPSVSTRISEQVQGIDPGSGLMQASEKAMREYGLGLTLVSASGAAMTAALDRAIRAHRWIVVTAWSPHWMFARWQLRYLDDPKGALGGSESVHALARHGFQQDFPPRVVGFFTRMYFPIGELEAALDDAVEHSVPEAAQRYIDAHQKRVEYWVTGNP